MTDIVLAWDFNFLHSLGCNERLGLPKNEFVSKPQTDYLVRDGTDYFYSTIFISEGKFARLGFHVENIEEKIHLTQTVVDFLNEQESPGIDIKERTFDLLGEKVKFKVGKKNSISKSFLNVSETFSEPMTSIIDKRPTVTKNKFISVYCPKILNGENLDENKVYVNKNCSVLVSD